MILAMGCGASHVPAPNEDVVSSEAPPVDYARETLQSMESVRDHPSCESCGSFRPDAVAMVGGDFALLSPAMTFVRHGDQWRQYTHPRRRPVSLEEGLARTGTRVLFQDREGALFELSAHGLRERGQAPVAQGIAVTGDEIYVWSDGQLLHREGDAWAALSGNEYMSYSQKTIAMSPRDAFVLDRECRVFQLASEGPNFEPTLVAETGISGACTLEIDERTGRLFALEGESSSALSIITGGQVRRVPLPPSEREPFVVDLLSVDPVIARRVTIHESGGSGQLVVKVFRLDDVATGTEWEAIEHETYPIDFAMHAFGTALPFRTSAVTFGDYRVTGNSYRAEVPGAAVTVLRRGSSEGRA